MFFEDHYDVPVITDYTYFDTPFGRFGTFICFDIIFEEPAYTLVDTHAIDSVAFPTAWMNVEPYYSASPFHQSFAVNMGVNFLAANLRLPIARFSGSGIYTPNETLVYRNGNGFTSELMVSEIPIKPTKTPYVNTQPIVEDFDVDFTGLLNNMNAPYITQFEDEYMFKSRPFREMYRLI